MQIIKAVSSKASIGIAIKYITKAEKTELKLISGIGCSPDTAIDDMKVTKLIWNKTDGRQYLHYIQSFSPNDNITPETAHMIGLNFAETLSKFNGYEILVSTHKDREHIHNHFIINSVSYETGKKYKFHLKTLKILKHIQIKLQKYME